jgi:putative flippase GtrA
VHILLSLSVWISGASILVPGEGRIIRADKWLGFESLNLPEFLQHVRQPVPEFIVPAAGSVPLRIAAGGVVAGLGRNEKNGCPVNAVNEILWCLAQRLPAGADKLKVKSATILVLKYSLFATIATLVNLGAQEVVVSVYQGRNSLFFSILLGTLSGLVCKYQLDKNFIFAYSTTSSAHDRHKFIQYTATGFFTTVLFWGFELFAEYLYGTKTARYTGAAIGLAIGYVVKYQLDKRYVFIQENP